MSLRNTIFFYAERIRSLAPWALPLKLGLGSILGVLGGAGLLGFLSEYATYSFSIYYGFRPPIEGIPYLKATVTFGSFVLLLTGGLIFLLSQLMVRLIVFVIKDLMNLFSKLFRYILPSKAESLFSFQLASAKLSSFAWWQIIGFSIAVGSVSCVVVYFQVEMLNSLNGNILPNPLYFSVASLIYVFIVVVATAKPSAIWWLGGIATMLYFIVAICILFYPPWHAVFLRTVGYGGGIPVNLELQEQDGVNRNIDCFLLIRTTEVFLILSDDSRKVLEIPRNQIRSISHVGGGLWQIPFKLPN